MPPSDDSVITQSDGSKLGEITFNWLMNMVQVQLLQQIGIKPSIVTFFSTTDTRVLEQGSATATYCGLTRST